MNTESHFYSVEAILSMLNFHPFSKLVTSGVVISPNAGQYPRASAPNPPLITKGRKYSVLYSTHYMIPDTLLDT